MNILCDGERLARLVNDLHALSGARVRVVDLDGRAICESGGEADYCALLRACPEGRERCRGCKVAAGSTCHAGICALSAPVRFGAHTEPVARLCAGQFVESNPLRPLQWEQLRPRLGWYPGDIEALREAFFALPALGAAEKDALSGMLETLAAYIRHEELIQPVGETDLQRLEHFLDEHYMDKLSLASVSASLHIGRTRLCALAKRLSGGQTLFALIAQRRIEAAKALLIRSDRPISAVAEAVGISDYNYFSKIFRAAAGISPSEFRKRSRGNLDNLV